MINTLIKSLTLGKTIEKQIEKKRKKKKTIIYNHGALLRSIKGINDILRTQLPERNFQLVHGLKNDCVKNQYLRNMDDLERGEKRILPHQHVI